MPFWIFPIGLYFIMPGTAIFMIGFAYPAVRMRVAALRVWWQHRRTYHQLGPLWTLLHQRFPENTFGRVPTSTWRDTLSLRGVHRRYYRRVIECRDGLVRISPYLNPNDGHHPSLAQAVHHSLHTHSQHNSVPHRPKLIAIPRHPRPRRRRTRHPLPSPTLPTTAHTTSHTGHTSTTPFTSSNPLTPPRSAEG